MAFPVFSSSVPSKSSVERFDLLSFDILTSPQSLLHTKVKTEFQDGVYSLLLEVKTKGVVTQKNQPNSSARPNFVIAQACMEFNLLQLLTDDPNSVICIVHTDTPTTPLCSDDDIGIESLISQQAQHDKGTQFSVELRKPIVHELCKKCSTTYPYYVVCKQSRLSAAESKTYSSVAEKRQHIEKAKVQDAAFDKNEKNENFHIQKLTNSNVTSELSGASYLYKKNSQWRYFGISAQQAKDADDAMDWKMWDVAVCSKEGKDLISTYNQVWPEAIRNMFSK